MIDEQRIAIEKIVTQAGDNPAGRGDYLIYFDTPVLGLLAQVRRITKPTLPGQLSADPQ